MLLAVPVLRPLGPRLLSATVCGIAAVESAVAGLLMDGTDRLRTPDRTEAVALRAAVVTVGGFVCWYMGTQRNGAERATLFSGLIPVAAACTAPAVGTGGYGAAQAAGQRAGRRRSGPGPGCVAAPSPHGREVARGALGTLSGCRPG
ncbi:hypothetical protein [Streptomyces sp. TP-A0356]|uniref:hypothetical protein n=1 Tax=Streptomyces sp. TP-A0356 TaxID=1359208 RepID=UPI000AE3B6D9